MASFNKAILVGNLTREIDLKYTGSGTPVCDIGLAVNDRVKKNNEWVDEVTFVDCTAFGRTAEIAGEFLTKGSPCLIEGRLKLEQWQSDGQNRSKLKVIVDKLQLLGSRDGQQARPSDSRSQPRDQRRAEPSQSRSLPADDDMDVPF